MITDVEAVENPVQRSLIYVGCTRALSRLVILASRDVRDELRIP